MSHLLARANEVLLEAQWLRREGRALRREAALRASELGKTILSSRANAENRADAPGPDQPAQAQERHDDSS